VYITFPALGYCKYDEEKWKIVKLTEPIKRAETIYNLLFSIKLDCDDNSSYDINSLLPLLQTLMQM
jgi:hypothetical protein